MAKKAISATIWDSPVRYETKAIAPAATATR